MQGVISLLISNFVAFCKWVCRLPWFHRRLSGNFCNNNYWYRVRSVGVISKCNRSPGFYWLTVYTGRCKFHTHTHTRTQIPQQAISSFKCAHRRWLLPIIRNQDQTLKKYKPARQQIGSDMYNPYTQYASHACRPLAQYHQRITVSKSFHVIYPKFYPIAWDCLSYTQIVIAVYRLGLLCITRTHHLEWHKRQAHAS